ncbi:peptidyl-prolyl cis-trans isomerase [Dysgonomonas sp. 25]|uniref:peptidylprolyl isomerase n=1 Tax=Dysgonomonas sp. 25 TaxID=2302933 RepID=UPI0013D414D7|nr:peptidylprolyl isomerase [Dysgonomonas sp. 25]NDV68961.1 peptidyl-prolyl cis-trans isomerase [Dysgonomonas sp. 25]
MNKLVINTILLFVILAGFSCKESGDKKIDENREPIVTVLDQTLYKDQVEAALPYKLSEKDSADFAAQYVQRWIADVLIYEKAKKNIIDNKTINQLVEDYRKSLIIHSYQDELLNNLLANSENLSDKKLEEFYEANKKQFTLKEPIIKGLYLKIPAESSQLTNFRKWYSQENENALGDIEKNALQNAVGYEYFYNKWVNFDQIFSTIPKQVSDKDQYVKTNKSVDVQDSSFVYLLHIKEYRLTGDEAPFEYVRDEVSHMLKERDRALYMKQIQEDLYNRAVADKEINFHNK